MEESELRKLLQTKNGCRIPKMRPIPDVHLMDKLPFTPLPPYNRIKVRFSSKVIIKHCYYFKYLILSCL